MTIHDNIEAASRRLAISFLAHRNGAMENVEYYVGEDILGIPTGYALLVSVKLIPPSDYTTWTIPELAELEGAAV